MKVRFRHINTGKLLTIGYIEKKSKDGKKPKKEMVLTLGDNLTAAEVNNRLDFVDRLIAENEYNPSFNWLTDAEVI